jgi:hypothetical protein
MCYERPASLAAVLDASVPTAGETLAAQQRLAPQFAELLAHLDLSPDDVVGATIFHTQAITPELLSMGEQLRDMAVDAPPHAGQWSRVEDKSAAVDAVWETTYDTVDWLDDGLLAYDALGAPLIHGNSEVTLRLTLPAAGAPPYPVVIYAHGLVQDRRFGEPVARELAAAGIATVAIDWPHHGARMENAAGPVGLRSDAHLPAHAADRRPRVRDAYRQGIGDNDVVAVFTARTGRSRSGSGGERRRRFRRLGRLAHRLRGHEPGQHSRRDSGGGRTARKHLLLNVGAANWRSMAFEGENDDVIGRIAAPDAGRRGAATELRVSRRLAAVLRSLPLDRGRRGFLQLRARRAGARRFVEHLAADGRARSHHRRAGGGELARALGMTLLEPVYSPIDGLPTAVAPFGGPAVYQFDHLSAQSYYWKPTR